MGEEADLVEERLLRGCRCFAVLSEAEIAGYGWLSAGSEWIGELSLGIRPGPGSAYIWNCVTMPAHRRRGLFRVLLEGIVDVTRREGLERLWIGSIDHLGKSAVAAAGFSAVLELSLLEAGPLRWLQVAAHPEADAGTVAALLESLGGGRGRLRSGPRYWRRRRH
jgi:GNAT superfamily N-acetyltransferase